MCKLLPNYILIRDFSGKTSCKHPASLNMLCIKMFPGPILAIYCVQLLHAITCPFTKYFQILYIYAQIFKYLILFCPFLLFF